MVSLCAVAAVPLSTLTLPCGVDLGEVFLLREGLEPENNTPMPPLNYILMWKKKKTSSLCFIM